MAGWRISSPHAGGTDREFSPRSRRLRADSLPGFLFWKSAENQVKLGMNRYGKNGENPYAVIHYSGCAARNPFLVYSTCGKRVEP